MSPEEIKNLLIQYAKKIENCLRPIDLKENNTDIALQSIKSSITILYLICGNLIDRLPNNQKKYFGNHFKLQRNRVVHGKAALISLYQANELPAVIQFIQQDIETLRLCLQNIDVQAPIASQVNTKETRKQDLLSTEQQYQILQYYYHAVNNQPDNQSIYLTIFNQIQFVEQIFLLADEISVYMPMLIKLKTQRNCIAHFDISLNKLDSPNNIEIVLKQHSVTMANKINQFIITNGKDIESICHLKNTTPIELNDNDFSDISTQKALNHIYEKLLIRTKDQNILIQSLKNLFDDENKKIKIATDLQLAGPMKKRVIELPKNFNKHDLTELRKKLDIVLIGSLKKYIYEAQAKNPSLIPIITSLIHKKTYLMFSVKEI